MCDETRRPACGGTRAAAGAGQRQNVVQRSTVDFVGREPRRMLHDELEMYRRGDDRRAAAGVLPGRRSTRVPQLDAGLPAGVRDPAGRGAAQRRGGQPPRRLAAVQRHRGLRSWRDYTSTARRSQRGSYVVWMAQPRRGLADTALGRRRRHLGPRSAPLRAARRRGATATCGAPTSPRSPTARAFSPSTDRIKKPSARGRRRRPGRRRRLRARARLADRGADVQRAARRGRPRPCARAGVVRRRCRPAPRSSRRTARAQALDARAGRRGLTFAAVAAGACRRAIRSRACPHSRS